MAFFRLIPNLTIMAPKDFKELEDMMEFAVNVGKPVVIRYPRGGEGKEKFNQHKKIEYQKAEILKEGKDVSIFAIGKTVERAVRLSQMLEKEGIVSEVINTRFLKPFDKESAIKSIEKTKNVITIEDGTTINGLSTTIKELIVNENLKNIKINTYAYPDKFIQHGTVEELEKIYHQDAESIYKDIMTIVDKKRQENETMYTCPQCIKKVKNMNKQEFLKDYKKQEDKLCLSQVLDKIEFCESREKLEYTDFLDMYQVALVENFLRRINFKNYQLFGGYEDSERKILIVYPDKYNDSMIEKNYSKMLKILRIELPEEEFGKYSHRNYLGGIVKLGLRREKVGDILVSNQGADIVVVSDFAEVLKQELPSLTRFENSKIEIKEISDIIKKEVKIEEVSIIVPSLRLDNIVSDLVKSSRSKAKQIIEQERVFVNGQNETKMAKQVKIGDIITIRGKGRFIVKEQTGTTRSGRAVLKIEKYI